MPHPPRLFPGDVELGKRDDDHKPGSKRPLAATWSYHRLVLRRSYRKIVLGLVLLVGLYYFFKNMPTDLGPHTARPDYDHPSAVQGPNRWSNSQSTKHKETGESTQSGVADSNLAEAETKHSFNGPIKFYELAASLGAIAKNTRGGALNMGHVLFVTSNVESATTLLLLACEMATFKRNHVHFAFMGRDDISLELLKEINGIKAGCEVWFHGIIMRGYIYCRMTNTFIDSRPDHLLQSSDFRMEVSSSAALRHIDNYMHPQAVIIDNSGIENLWFLKAMRDRSSLMGKTLIELPDGVHQSIRWMTRLDSSSLQCRFIRPMPYGPLIICVVWNKISIDVLIHAQTAASGSVLRLLDSLSKADYSKSAPPRLTIELPHDVEAPTKKFLEDFRWPPAERPLEGNANQLNLRHRIPETGLTAEENSIRFLESFWPVKPATSHLLVLSPQVELSPLYFQYLKYYILEYRYSTQWAGEKQLMGISLDLPSTYLNDTTTFSPPRKAAKGNSDIDEAISFLWQAPNSNAVLYFGDMWIELHSFLSHSLVSQHKLPTPTTINSPEVGKTYPSWLESILRLARTRGYYFLYSTLANQVGLATIHNELYKPPEEFSNSWDVEEHLTPQISADFTADPAHHLSLQHTEKPLASKSLLNLLPSDGILPSLTDMPLLSWDGKAVKKMELEEAASNYSQVFRREVGGCNTLDEHKAMIEGSADDLFCLDDTQT
jgi:hypothetical protein